MARKRRTPAVLGTARRRLAGLKSITPSPNLGASLRHTDAYTLTEWTIHGRWRPARNLHRYEGYELFAINDSFWNGPRRILIALTRFR